jgi:hypothetical protein
MLKSYCNTDPNCPTDIKAELDAIEAAAGGYAVSDANPTGLAAYYDVASPTPWRIADDGGSESFATAEEAREAAADWADEMGD